MMLGLKSELGCDNDVGGKSIWHDDTLLREEKLDT